MADRGFKLTNEEVEELKALTPERRIARLKQIEQERRKALEEAEAEAEATILEAENLIKETEEEIDEDAQEVREQEKDAKDDNLEEMLKKENPPEAPTSGLYQPFGKKEEKLYSILEEAASNLERLYGRKEWSSDDVRLYERTKEQVHKAESYQLSNKVLSEELNLAASALHRMHYRM